MLGLGISLASEPAETALCFVGLGSGRQHVAAFVGLTDEELIAVCELPDRVAIDAPFGFARAFTEDVFAWAEEGSWPAGREERRPYRRATERFVEARTPLPLFLSERDNGAFVRCAGVLGALAAQGGGLDLVRGHAIEAYPPAALQRWAFGLEPYRGAGLEENRATLLDRLDVAAGLHLPPRPKGCASGAIAPSTPSCAPWWPAAPMPGSRRRRPERSSRRRAAKAGPTCRWPGALDG